ncbi:MAG: lytic transglycosylase domain-containing protein [Cocleimonas sp.]|nr:lytic transglycosylase domain-containing protein [Cocleimonas sp.]
MTFTGKRIKGKNSKLFKRFKPYKNRKIVLNIKPSWRKKNVRRTLYKSVVKGQYKGNGIIHGCSNKAHLLSKARAYAPTIRLYAKNYEVEEELIHAIVKQESCFNERAHSRAGAMGLMQLMPGTADMMKISDPWDPEQNIEGGTKYIARMLRLFKGNKRWAIAAYNAGPGKVKKYRGIPPYRETKNYVKKVMAEYYHLKKQGLPHSLYSLASLR